MCVNCCVQRRLLRYTLAVFCKTVFLVFFFFSQILFVISIVMDSDSECDRRSVSKANTTRMFEARARKGRRFQGLTQAAAASRGEALEEDVSDEVDADSDEPSLTSFIQVSLTPAAQCRAEFEPCDEQRLAEQKSP